jgi:acyl-coenzyme A thioesterase 13
MTNKILEYFKSNIGHKMGDKGPSLVAKWLDGKLIAAESGSLTFEFEVKPDFTNPVKILHGGVASAIMDEVIGATVYSLEKDAFYASVNLNVDFLNPAKEGEVIIARSQVIRNGNTIVHVECQIHNENGDLIAKSVSNMVRTKFGLS